VGLSGGTAMYLMIGIMQTDPFMCVISQIPRDLPSYTQLIHTLYKIGAILSLIRMLNRFPFTLVFA
jgi:hypothetical protein